MSTVQGSSPSSYYRFEETSGTSAADLGSRNLPATYSGGFTLNQPGIPGGDPTDLAVKFNGTSGFALVGGSYSVAAYPLSIEAFFKTTNATSTNQKIAGLANNGTATGNGSENIGVYVQSGKAALRIRNSAADQSFQGAVPKVVSDGNWHQIVGVFDGPNQRELYVDGALVTSSTTTAALPNVNTLDIGALGRNAPLADFFNGTIDEVSYYPTALSAATVADHYAASGVPEPASLGLLAAGSVLLLRRRRQDRA